MVKWGHSGQSYGWNRVKDPEDFLPLSSRLGWDCCVIGGNWFTKRASGVRLLELGLRVAVYGH